MILTCGQCQTKYMVKSESVGTAGRSVKCVKCGHIWKQFPEGTTPPGQVEPIPEAVKSIPKGGALPVSQDGTIPMGLKLLPVAFMLATVMVTALLYQAEILRRVPQLAVVYEKIGVPDVRQVALQDLAISHLPGKEEDEEVFVIKGKLINNAKKASVLPSLKISIQDKNHSVIRSFTLKSTGEILDAGSALNFSNTLPPLPKTAYYATVDIGNKVDLLVR